MFSTAPPRDFFWYLADAVTPLETAVLRSAVAAHRGRELIERTLFADGTPVELAREAALKTGDRLYIAGGDGSVHAAVEGVFAVDPGKQRLPEFAILPRGTGNDFARTLQMPLEDWETIVRCAVWGNTVRCDVGYLNERVFVNAVTMGFGAEATRDIPAGLKAIAGGAGYAALTAWKALTADPFELTVECAGGERWQGEALALIVLNGKSVGGGARFGVAAALDDGQLDLVILPSFGAGDLPELIDDWRQVDPEGFEHVRYFQSPTFEIRSSRSLALSIDGEPSSGDRFSLRVEQQATRWVEGDVVYD